MLLPQPKAERQARQNEHWHPFTDAYSAYLAEDFPALHDLQMREQYGDDWENCVMHEYVACENVIEDKDYHEGESSEMDEELTIIESDDGDDWIPF